MPSNWVKSHENEMVDRDRSQPSAATGNRKVGLLVAGLVSLHDIAPASEPLAARQRSLEDHGNTCPASFV